MSELVSTPARPRHARARLLAAALVGAVAGVLIQVRTGQVDYAVALGWTGAAVAFVTRTWWVVGRMSSSATAAHAAREEPGGVVLTEVIEVLACVASLGAVGYLVIGSTSADRLERGLAGVATVLISWIVLHTIYALRYARLYYSGSGGGIEFPGGEPPRYTDFAYLAFTLGMTYQVSDTDLSSRTIRSTALGHCLLSYLFGTVVLASTVNAVLGLVGAGLS